MEVPYQNFPCTFFLLDIACFSDAYEPFECSHVFHFTIHGILEDGLHKQFHQWLIYPSGLKKQAEPFYCFVP